jgi:hypothetical protein
MLVRWSRMYSWLAVFCALASASEAQSPGADARVARLTGRVADAVGVAIVNAEVLYNGGATVAPQFGGRESTCGVIAVWTRHGQKKK